MFIAYVMHIYTGTSREQTKSPCPLTFVAKLMFIPKYTTTSQDKMLAISPPQPRESPHPLTSVALRRAVKRWGTQEGRGAVGPRPRWLCTWMWRREGRDGRERSRTRPRGQRVRRSSCQPYRCPADAYLHRQRIEDFEFLVLSPMHILLSLSLSLSLSLALPKIN